MFFNRSDRLLYEPLNVAHAVLLHPALSDVRIYEFINSTPPTIDALASEFACRVTGPPSSRSNEQWINYAIGISSTETIYIGRIEATLYGDWGEIGFLFGPTFWGKGYATEAITWFHGQLAELGVVTLWATVAPGNLRSLNLIRKLGYIEVPSDLAPKLASYDPGDICLRFQMKVLPSHLNGNNLRELTDS